jgi:hypothetical protein
MKKPKQNETVEDLVEGRKIAVEVNLSDRGPVVIESRTYIAEPTRREQDRESNCLSALERQLVAHAPETVLIHGCPYNRIRDFAESRDGMPLRHLVYEIDRKWVRTQYGIANALAKSRST